ncbi:13126_t:CDS:2, partial [Dentiscutata erythropus]
MTIMNMSCSKKYSKWLEEELQKGNIAFYKYSEFENVEYIGKEILDTLDKMPKETVDEVFITNRNRRLIPILTRNGSPNLLSVGPSTQIFREPSSSSFRRILNRSNSSQ